MRHGQAQPGSLSYALGGEERFDRALLGLFVHAMTRIRDADHHIGSPVHARGHGLRGIAKLRSDDQPAPLRHRIARVDRQVQQGHLDLMGIGVRHRQIRSQIEP